MNHSIRRSALFLGLLVVFCGKLSAETGLLLVAHGAPESRWNQPVLDFGSEVAKQALKEGKFKAVRTAMLEFAKPDVPEMLEELKSSGCRRILVVPLFIAPSEHTDIDLPEVLGICTSRDQKPIGQKTDAEENVGQEAAVSMKVAGALNEGDLLREFALRQVRQLSTNPSEEALVLLAHGDEHHREALDREMIGIASYCCGRMGIDCADWAYVEMGQGYAGKGVEAIQRGLARKKSVLVVGLYLSTSAEGIYRFAKATAKKSGDSETDPLAGKDVRFASEGVIRHPGLSERIVKSAAAALEQSSTKASETQEWMMVK
jgi:sirohydrochlorin ferrochelatase